MSSNVKEVFFNPSLNYDNLNYNVDKNNCITQDINIDLSNFDASINMSGGAQELEKKEEIKHKFENIRNLDPILNNVINQPIQLGGGEKQSIQLGGGSEEPIQLGGDEEEKSIQLGGSEEEPIQLGGNSKYPDLSDEEYYRRNPHRNNSDTTIKNNQTLILTPQEKEIENKKQYNIANGGAREEESIDLDISSYDEIIHPLVNINSVKKLVNKWITNFNSDKKTKYENFVKTIYQKNNKKYEIKRDNNKLNLYDIKKKNIISSIKIPIFKNIDHEREKLKEKIILEKQQLINLYLNVKRNSSKDKLLLTKFNKKKDEYKQLLQLLTSYNIYEKLINKDNKDNTNNEDNKNYDEVENNEDNEKNYDYVFLPNLKSDFYSKIYIENQHYKINKSLIKEILIINKEKTTKYNDILQKINSKDIKKEDNIKNDILEYIDNQKKKDFNNKINLIKNKTNNRIDYIIDVF